MARPQRVDPKMGWHHVTNHVVGTGDLFLSDDDRHLFLRLVVWAAKRTQVQVAGFCLMGNHFHLVLLCPDGRLSEFMQLVESVYAKSFSDRRGYRGPVFVGRFHNTVITSDEQLLVTIRYVDRNPVELGIDVASYPWSSFQTHLGGAGAHDPSLRQSCDIPVRLCGGPANYQALVSTDGPSDKFAFAAGRRVVHGTAFRPIDEILTEFAWIAAQVSGVDADELVASSRGARSGARLAAVFVAHKIQIAFSDELCQFFGFSARSSLASAINRARPKLLTHVAFRALVEQIETTWYGSRLDLGKAS